MWRTGSCTLAITRWWQAKPQSAPPFRESSPKLSDDIKAGIAPRQSASKPLSQRNTTGFKWGAGNDLNWGVEGRINAASAGPVRLSFAKYCQGLRFAVRQSRSP